MASTVAGASGRTSPLTGLRALRTRRTGLRAIRSDSSASCRMLPSSVSAFSTEVVPAPDAIRSACQRAITSGVSSPSFSAPSDGPMWASYSDP